MIAMSSPSRLGGPLADPSPVIMRLLLSPSLEMKEPQMANQKTQILVRKMQPHTAELHVMEAAVYAAALVARSKKAERHDPYEAVAGSVVGCSRSKIWSLVHRPRSLKSIASHIREGLASAYARECERQKRLLEHEINIASAITASSNLVAEGQALLRDLEGQAQ